MNIYLVGFMGTGKTAVGKELAKRLNRKFLDLDDLIEEREKRKITDIFAEDGEAYFRKVEKEVLFQVSQERDTVFSCGGGIVLDSENIQRMKETGMMICLFARPEVILERTKNYKHRPLLNVCDPLKKITELLDFRQPYYEKADYKIDTSDLEIRDVVERILEIIK